MEIEEEREKDTIIVEPIEDPVPRREPVPEPDRELVPAGVIAVPVFSRRQVATYTVSAIEGLRSLGELPTTRELAAKLNVSTATVDRARHLVERGSPEMINAVKKGELPLATAYKRICGP